MSHEEAGIPTTVATTAVAAAHRRRLALGPALHFRIVSDHEHRAVAGSSAFSCTRESITTEAVVSYRWSAFKDTTLLKRHCRTLNEAKQQCRAAVGADSAAV